MSYELVREGISTGRMSGYARRRQFGFQGYGFAACRRCLGVVTAAFRLRTPWSLPTSVLA